MPVLSNPASGRHSTPFPRCLAAWFLLESLLLVGCAPEPADETLQGAPARDHHAAATQGSRIGPQASGRESDSRPPILAAEPTRLAQADAALGDGEPLAAIAILLGTPAPTAAERTTTATARALPAGAPAGTAPTLFLPPLSGAELEAVLDGLPPVAQQLYARALDAAGRPVGAAQAWEHLAASLPALADRFWMEAGNAFFKAGEDEAALRTYTLARDLLVQSAHRSADQRSLAELRRGNALLRLGRLPEALQAYEAAGDQAGEAAQAQALAGAIAVHLAAGRDDAAAETRLRLIRDLPGSSLAPTALTRLKASGVAVNPVDEARLLAAQGDPAAAATLAPDHLPEGIDWLLAAGEPERALALAESGRAGEEAATLASALDLRRTQALRRLGRTAEAAEAFRDLARKQPGTAAAAEAWWEAARLYETAGDLPGAAVAYAQAAAVRPASDGDATSPNAPDRTEEASFRAGLCRWRLGERAAARTAWAAGLAIAVDRHQRARLAYWTGRAAQADGDAAAAREYWVTAEAAAPLTVHGLLARALRQGGAVRDADPLEVAIGSGSAANDEGAATGDQVGSALQAPSETLERVEAWLSLGDRQSAEQLLVPGLDPLVAAGDSAALAAIAGVAERLDLGTLSLRAAALALDQAGSASLEDASTALLALAYPTDRHGGAIRRTAAEAGVPAQLLFALVRQESRFKADAVSNAGAVGLTQMMPDTGALVAGWLGDEGFQPDDLRDPGTSLRYGARFLAWLLERYDGRVWPALAAYNAGPGPVDGWLEASDGDMDVFLELIDYPETSSYLRGVAVASALYRWRWAELR